MTVTVTVPVYVFHYEKLVIQRYFTYKSIFNVSYTYKIVVTLQTYIANFSCDTFAVFNCF